MVLFPLILLIALLAAAVWHDVRVRRIPNAIVFPGALAALALSILLPSGPGLLSALGGMALGLAVLLPMYAFGLMGAGDVKLLAMVGAFTGASHILTISLFTLAAGGVLALIYAAAHGKLRQSAANAWQMAVVTGMSAAGGHLAVAKPATASGRLPYAIAVAAGTVPCVLWLYTGGVLPL